VPICARSRRCPGGTATGCWPRGDRDRLLAPEFVRALGDYEPISVLARHAAEAGEVDPLARAQHVDLMTWLPGRMLVKVDRASMAHGLELRPLFLDHELVDWAARLPADMKLQGMSGKRLLKRALEPLVPHELLYRPKQGFSLPLARWLRGELRPRIESLATRGAIADAGLFSPSGLRRVIGEHGDGRRDHTPILWAMLMLDAFLRTQRPALAPPRETVAA
jgi:asparagine synthase (glutamine-hydrolysing)